MGVLRAQHTLLGDLPHVSNDHIDSRDFEDFLALFENPSFALGRQSQCNYHPERTAALQAFRSDRLPGELYQRLMDHHFRRSGMLFYRPVCPACRACVPIRIPVQSFRPSRSQRRCYAKNTDLRLEIRLPSLDEERLSLYQRYLAYQHPDTQQGASESSLRQFLYSSPVDTWEFGYYLDKQVGGTGQSTRRELIAVSIVDCCSQSYSSVYHFFAPEHAHRSLGVFSVLREIELAREKRIPYYYLGYWVEGCSTMEYKKNYRPHELLIGQSWKTDE
ncbi:MAG: arginyltransferase [Myxococcota bacterium]|jgi:arginine-tRNA-protein transferase|nr:arginyltransferase [Myxococcota bacterium]